MSEEISPRRGRRARTTRRKEAPAFRLKYAIGFAGFGLDTPYVVLDTAGDNMYGPASWDECIARRRKLLEELKEVEG